MPRFEYSEDPKTGDRIVTARNDSATGPLHGQCDCGSSIGLTRSGSPVECGDCGAIYRLIAKP